MPPSFSVRRAGPSDVDVLCLLIRKLADYERLAHGAEPDASQLALHLDPASSPPCGAYLAEAADGTPVGFALFYLKYSTFLTEWGIHLEDLFVLPEYRRRGIGLELMRCVAREAQREKCGRLELSVLDWNRNAIDFYERLGARPLDDWTTYRFAGRALTELAGRSTTS